VGGKESAEGKGKTDAEVLNKGLFQVSFVRQSERVYEKVRDLPDMFQDDGVKRAVARGGKVELVMRHVLLPDSGYRKI